MNDRLTPQLDIGEEVEQSSHVFPEQYSAPLPVLYKDSLEQALMRSLFDSRNVSVFTLTTIKDYDICIFYYSQNRWLSIYTMIKARPWRSFLNVTYVRKRSLIILLNNSSSGDGIEQRTLIIIGK
jgi:hypothetical protein